MIMVTKIDSIQIEITDMIDVSRKFEYIYMQQISAILIRSSRNFEEFRQFVSYMTNS